MANPNSPDTQTEFKAELRTVWMSFAIGVLLMALKFAVFFVTRSTAIFSDAMENVVNVLTSAFAIYAVSVAHQPADNDHPYGHGKIEFLSAGFEGGMLLLAALVILVRASESLAIGPHLADLRLGIIVTVISTGLCAVMGVILLKRGKTGGSITLEADGVHLVSDAVTGTAVLAALVAIHFTHVPAIDPLAAMAVSVWIVWQAAILLRRSVAGLMDEQDRADAAVLQRVLDGHLFPRGAEPLICSYHKLRHRHTGRHHWVEFHIQVPADWDVDQGHRVASAIEIEIQNTLGDCSATAHVEPCAGVGCGRCKVAEAPLVSKQ